MLLTPETSVQAQKAFAADITVPLDELLPYNASPARVRESVFRTHRWEARSLAEHLKDVREQARGEPLVVVQLTQPRGNLQELVAHRRLLAACHHAFIEVDDLRHSSVTVCVSVAFRRFGKNKPAYRCIPDTHSSNN